jgi:hypothetical protein
MHRWMRSAPVLLAGCLLGLPGATAMAQGLGKLAAAAPVNYDNRYEIFGGLNFMNGQAGQDLPKRFNMGGAELSGTYWFSNHLGGTLDLRVDAGTTPVFPNSFVPPIRRPVVYETTGMAGVSYRGSKNHYAAVDYHALFGVSDGVFNKGTGGVSPAAVGLYTNRVKPMAALGGSLDFNYSKNIAIRLSPDLILEHFGTETREFVAVSGGVIYRFGKR